MQKTWFSFFGVHTQSRKNHLSTPQNTASSQRHTLHHYHHIVASSAANTSPKPTPTSPPKAKPQLSGNKYFFAVLFLIENKIVLFVAKLALIRNKIVLFVAKLLLIRNKIVYL